MVPVTNLAAPPGVRHGGRERTRGLEKSDGAKGKGASV